MRCNDSSLPLLVVFARYWPLRYGLFFVTDVVFCFTSFFQGAIFCNSKALSLATIARAFCNCPMCPWVGMQEQDFQYSRCVWIFHDLWDLWFPIYCFERREESKTNREKKKPLWILRSFCGFPMTLILSLISKKLSSCRFQDGKINSFLTFNLCFWDAT